MRKYNIMICCAFLLGTMSCTSLSEGAQSNELVTEPDRRVPLQGDRTADLRDRMDEQSSEINRKRNIEEFDRNEPAMTPPDLRPQQVPLAPVDSVVHNNTEWLRPNLFKSRLILNR